MRKNRLIGWVLSVAMLAGMLPAQALAAPTTAQGDKIDKYVTFQTENKIQSGDSYKLTVQVWRDNAIMAEQGFQYGSKGPGKVTITPSSGYRLDKMTITPQDDVSGEPDVFTSGNPIAITSAPRTLAV